MQDNINDNDKNINQSTSKASLCKNFTITTSNIFIGARQNLKAQNIRLINHSKYNNTVHREISNFKNGKGKSVDKANISLSENDALKNNNYNTQNKKDESMNVLKEIDLRWKSNQKINKNNFSFISKANKKDNKDNKDLSIINKKIYIKELLNSIKGVTNNIENSDKSNNNNNREYYILIKHNKDNTIENIMHEIISPNSNEELEKSINNFIYKKDNKENQNNNAETLSNSDNSTFNNGRKKSKFSHYEHKKSNSSNSNNTEDIKEEFIPIFILTKKELINLYEIIEGKSKNNTKEKKEYSIDKNIAYNIINNNKTEKLRALPENNNEINKNIQNENDNNNKTEKLRALPENKNEINQNIQNENDKNENKKKLDNINYNIFPVKAEKFELINKKNKKDSDEKRNGNNNIDVIAKEFIKDNYIKTLNKEENEVDYIHNKNKEMEDFGQVTPISLLKEKYFIYIVSKWVKYSIPQPQSQIYAKYSYKNGHPLFDPIILQMTNFTLWIERIESKNNLNKKLFMSVNSSQNYDNNIKKTNSKGIKKK